MMAGEVALAPESEQALVPEQAPVSEQVPVSELEPGPKRVGVWEPN